MKRKMDWDDKEESGKEDNSTSDEESDDEEPRIKDVLNNLSNAVFRKDASELLHSRDTTSRDILFWTPSGLLLRNQRKIPVTNISELVEYVLLPHHEDVAKPRALNTFLDGLAELGINKRLMKNKKLLSDLLEKEIGSRGKEEEQANEENEGNSSDGNDEDETASENSQANEFQNSGSESDGEDEVENNDSENSTIAQANVHDACQHCEGSHGYDTVVMKCPKCFWEDNCKICPICDHKIPLERKHARDSLRRCYVCGAITHKDERTLKITFYPPSDEEEDD